MQLRSEDLKQEMFRDLCSKVADIVGELPPVDAATRFGDIGLDSAGALTLTSRLARQRKSAWNWSGSESLLRSNSD